MKRLEPNSARFLDRLKSRHISRIVCGRVEQLGSGEGNRPWRRSRVVAVAHKLGGGFPAAPGSCRKSHGSRVADEGPRPWRTASKPRLAEAQSLNASACRNDGDGGKVSLRFA